MPKVIMSTIRSDGTMENFIDDPEYVLLMNIGVKKDSINRFHVEELDRYVDNPPRNQNWICIEIFDDERQAIYAACKMYSQEIGVPIDHLVVIDGKIKKSKTRNVVYDCGPKMYRYTAKDLFDDIQKEKEKEPNYGNVSARQRYLILRRDGYRCQICGKSASNGVQLHIDHKVPRSKVGSSDEDNLWVLCQDCNLGKHDLDL